MNNENNERKDILQLTEEFLSQIRNIKAGMNTASDILDKSVNELSYVKKAFDGISDVYIPHMPTALEYAGTTQRDMRTLMASILGVKERIGRVISPIFQPFDYLMAKMHEYAETGQETGTEPYKRLTEQLKNMEFVRKLIQRKLRPEHTFQIGTIDELNELLGYDYGRSLLGTEEFDENVRGMTRYFRNNVFSLQGMVRSIIGEWGDADGNTPLNELKKVFSNRIEKMQEALKSITGEDIDFSELAKSERYQTDIAKTIRDKLNIPGAVFANRLQNYNRELADQLIQSIGNLSENWVGAFQHLTKTHGIGELLRGASENDINRVIEGIRSIPQPVSERINYRNLYKLLNLRSQLATIPQEEIQEHELGIANFNAILGDIDIGIAKTLMGENVKINGIIDKIEKSNIFADKVDLGIVEGETANFGIEISTTKTRAMRSIRERLKNTGEVKKIYDRIIEGLEKGESIPDTFIDIFGIEKIAESSARTEWQKNERLYKVIGGKYGDEESFVEEYSKNFVENYKKQIEELKKNALEEITRYAVTSYTQQHGPIAGIYNALEDTNILKTPEMQEPVKRLLSEASESVLTNISQIQENLIKRQYNTLKSIEKAGLTMPSRLVERTSKYETLMGSLQSLVDVGMHSEVVDRQVGDKDFADLYSQLNQKYKDVNERKQKLIDDIINNRSEENLRNRVLTQLDADSRIIENLKEEKLKNVLEIQKTDPERYKELVKETERQKPLTENITPEIIAQVQAETEFGGYTGDKKNQLRDELLRKQLRLREIYKAVQHFDEYLPQKFIKDLGMTAAEEDLLDRSLLTGLAIEHEIPVTDLRTSFNNLSQYYQRFTHSIQQHMGTIFETVRRRGFTMNWGFDPVGGLSPNMYGTTFTFLKNVTGGGLSVGEFATITQRINHIMRQISLPFETETYHQSIRQFREGFQQFKRSIDILLEAFGSEGGEVPTPGKGRFKEAMKEVYEKVGTEEEFGTLREEFMEKGVTFEGGKEDIQRFTKAFGERMNVFNIESLSGDQLKRYADNYVNAFNEILEPSLQELETGKSSITTKIQTLFRGMGESFATITSFMSHSLMFVMSIPMTSGLWMAGMEPTRYAMSATTPIYYGIGGLTGMPTLQQALSQFAFTLPQHLSMLQQQFITISTLMRSSVAGESAVGTALSIARWEPIQYEEAMQTIMAFTVFPETREAIKQPEFQRQVLESVELLGMLVPEQGTSGAIFAIRELLGNQFRSIERRFNISRELLASYAGVTMEEFKDLPGSEKLRALYRGLSELFAGGDEVLLQRGFMFDVQIKNIIDTLIQNMIKPLAITQRPEVQQTLYGLSTYPIVSGKAIEKIIPEQYEQYKIIAGRYYKSLPEEERKEYGKDERSAIEEIAVRLFATQNSTVSGMLSTFFAFLNQSTGVFLSNINFGSVISNFLRDIFEPVFATHGGFITRWSNRISLLESSNVPTDVWRTTFIDFIGDLADTVNEGVNRFKSIVNTGEFSDIIEKIGNTVMNVGMSTMEPIVTLATKAGARVTLQIPRVIGGILTDSISDIVDYILPSYKTQSRVEHGTYKTLGTIADIGGTLGLYHGIATMTRQGEFGRGLSMIALSTVLPSLIRDITSGNILDQKTMMESLIVGTAAAFTFPSIGRTISPIIGKIPGSFTAFEGGTGAEINRGARFLSSIFGKVSRNFSDAAQEGSGLLQSAKMMPKLVGKLATIFLAVSAARDIYGGVQSLQLTEEERRQQELKPPASYFTPIAMGAAGAAIASQFGSRFSIKGMEGATIGYLIGKEISDIISISSMEENIGSTISDTFDRSLSQLRLRQEKYQHYLTAGMMIAGTGIGTYFGMPGIGAIGGGIIGRFISKPITDFLLRDEYANLYRNMGRTAPKIQIDELKFHAREQAEAEIKMLGEAFGADLIRNFNPQNIIQSSMSGTTISLQDVWKPKIDVKELLEKTKTIHFKEGGYISSVPTYEERQPTRIKGGYITTEEPERREVQQRQIPTIEVRGATPPLYKIIRESYTRPIEEAGTIEQKMVKSLVAEPIIKKSQEWSVSGSDFSGLSSSDFDYLINVNKAHTTAAKNIEQMKNKIEDATNEAQGKLVASGDIVGLNKLIIDAAKSIYFFKRNLNNTLKKELGVSLDVDKLNKYADELLQGKSAKDIQSELFSDIGNISLSESVNLLIEQYSKQFKNINKQANEMVEKAGVSTREFTLGEFVSSSELDSKIVKPMVDKVNAINSLIQSGGAEHLIRRFGLKEVSAPEFPKYQLGESWRSYESRVNNYVGQLRENYQAFSPFISEFGKIVSTFALLGDSHPFESARNIVLNDMRRHGSKYLSDPRILMSMIQSGQLTKLYALGMLSPYDREVALTTLRKYGAALVTESKLTPIPSKIPTGTEQPIGIVGTTGFQHVSTVTINAGTVNISSTASQGPDQSGGGKIINK